MKVSPVLFRVFALCSASNAAIILYPRDCVFQWAASTGDTCESMASDWDITVDQFIRWNPKVNCDALIIGQNYCLGWQGPEPSPISITTMPMTATASSTVATTPTISLPSVPCPTQDGIARNCQRFHLVSYGDTCGVIVAKYGTFTLADFYKWNPAVGTSCTSLQLDYYVCIGVVGTPTTPTKAPATPTPSGGPVPVQDGIASDCQRYHKVVDGDTCQAIVSKYKTFTLADFHKWNPAIGTSCQGLWLDYYVCIGVKGTPTKPITTSTLPPTATPTNTRPSPTQPNVSKNCNKWYKVASGDFCQKIADQFKITLANFYKWNPDVGSNCGALWLDTYMCVGSK